MPFQNRDDHLFGGHHSVNEAYERATDIPRHGDFDGGSHAGVPLRSVHIGGPARPAVAAFRTAALAEPSGKERVVIIDTGPDFREQALRNGLTRVDAVFYTHAHADHIHGLDDLRPLSFTVFREGGPILLYATAETTAVLERIYDYTFSPHATYPTRARVQLEPLAERTHVHGVEFLRVPVMHGEMKIAGFRFGRAAYLTDVSAIPGASFDLLEGLDVWCFPRCATSRIPATLRWSRRSAGRAASGRKQTWLTHIAHELGHEETNRTLPAGIRLAFDGLSIACRCGPGPFDRRPMMTVRPMISVFRSVQEIPAGFGPSVAAIGNFDGVHLGHQEILRRSSPRRGRWARGRSRSPLIRTLSSFCARRKASGCLRPWMSGCVCWPDRH